MVEELLEWLEANEGPGAYAVLALAAALEYVVPPLPGDTIALFGTFLAATAGYRVWVVYLTLTGGAISGSLLAYGFGLFVGRREERWPRFMRGERTKRAIDKVLDRFERHGSVYLALNRFVPAFRAFFFLAAGMRGMEAWKVVVFGGASAAGWNLLILALGWSVGHNWERLYSLAEGYELAVVAALALVGVVLFVRFVVKRRAR
jgi:membrane protein DedA with SNARE-associated domain